MRWELKIGHYICRMEVTPWQEESGRTVVTKAWLKWSLTIWSVFKNKRPEKLTHSTAKRSLLKGQLPMQMWGKKLGATPGVPKYQSASSAGQQHHRGVLPSSKHFLQFLWKGPSSPRLVWQAFVCCSLTAESVPAGLRSASHSHSPIWHQLVHNFCEVLQSSSASS